MSPWDVLGVPRGTTDATVIRRAYAAKVKEHPPDLDPDGFRRVREAYELLREPVRRVPVDSDAPEESEADDRSDLSGPRIEPTILAEREARNRTKPEPPAPDAPLREARPRERADEIEAVRRAAALPKGPERDERLRAALRALGDRMRGDRRLVPAWSRAVLETLRDPERPLLLVSSVRYDDVVLDLIEAEGEVAASVIESLRESGDYECLDRLARRILDTRGEPRHDIGRVLALLAAGLAIVSANLARALADRAFRSAVRKEAAIPAWLDLDRRLAAGREVLGAAPEVRRFLAARVDGLAWDESDAGATAGSALQLVARMDSSNTLRTLLHERDPGLVASATARYRPRPAREKTGSSRLLRILLFIGIALGALRICSFEDKPKTQPPAKEDWRERLRDDKQVEDEARRWAERLRRPGEERPKQVPAPPGKDPAPR